MHQLALYETRTGLLLKEQVVGDKQHELSMVAPFLTPLWVKDRLISADAWPTQHAFGTHVDCGGGFSLLIAKGHQCPLREDLQLFFKEPPADCRDWRAARPVNKGHGRLAIRELIARTELNDFLANDWTGVPQVFCLPRTVPEKGQSRQEVVSGMTNLPLARACAADLLARAREHWAIEQRLHWRRDVTLRQDHSPVRKGVAPPILALLNSFLLAVLDF